MFGGFTSWLSSLTSQPVLTAIGAGLVGGALTGTALMVMGTLPGPPDPELTVLSCFRDGKAIARVTSGSQMLVTARSADGEWLELYIGLPDADRGWVPASALRFETATSSLPLGDCIGLIALATVGPSAAPLPTAEPSAAPPTIIATVLPAVSLAPGATPTPTAPPTPTSMPLETTTAPTVTPLTPPPTIPPPTIPPPTPTPTPTPIPTPPPDVTKPTITAVSISGVYQNGINYYLNCNSTVATIKVSVSDTGGSGVNASTVKLRWKDPFGLTHAQVMSWSLLTRRWSGTITWNTNWPDNPKNIDYWITAADNAGNTATTTHPPDSQHWLFQEQVCVD